MLMGGRGQPTQMTQQISGRTFRPCCKGLALISCDLQKAEAEDYEYRHDCEKEKERDEIRIREKKIGRERDNGERRNRCYD